jgi:carbamoylphosphate synthase large subunit
VHVVATDMAPRNLVAGSSLADDFVQVPAVSAKADFTDALLQLIAKEKITHYWPTFDGEIVLAAHLRDLGHLDGVSLLAPPTWAAELCWDKLAAARRLHAAGFPAPKTSSLPTAEWTATGVCIKPRRGVGSVGVEILDKRESFVRRQQAEDAPEYIAQELLTAPELTLDCFRSLTGRVRAVCRERIEVKSGVCTKARVFENQDLSELAAAVGQELALTGGYCLQVMRDRDTGAWKLTDINPRPGAGTRLTTAVGVDIPAATLALAFGTDPWGFLPRLEREHFVVRQYREIVLA